MTPTAEFKLVPLRETAPPHTRPLGDTPEAIATYWREQIETSDMYRPTVENCAVVFVNMPSYSFASTVPTRASQGIATSIARDVIV